MSSMNIRIDLLNGRGNGLTPLKEILETAFKPKGFTTLTSFSNEVAKKLGTTPHGEIAILSRAMRQGITGKLDPKRAKVYANLLDIPEETLLSLNNVVRTKSNENKAFCVDPKLDITSVIKQLSQRDSVSAEDLMKELLWLTHQ